MAILERSEFLHQRGADNQLLTEVVTLDDGSGEVELTPLTKGELNELQRLGKAGVDIDAQNKSNAEILARHLVNPKFSVEELMSEEFKALKFAQLSGALLKASGYDLKKKQ